ncbi:olfactory receptor 8U1-like [Pleurodeles waltl]|uniref:olfactory receptor 8U1-like n=1 Tax=Pleurodeles waltl TaxID=8319 RepID=UPI0037093CA0
MNEENQTVVKEFILLGLTNDKKLQVPLFVIFLLIYIITLVGNISIMTLIRISQNLQTPMYFLISNLSFVDICYSSDFMPRLLVNFLLERNVISLPECGIQLFVSVCMAGLEVLILVAMAYDRYTAICNPLLYPVIMTSKRSIHLVALSYCIAFSNAMMHTISIFRLSFCGSNRINHFFCDILPLLRLSCSNTSVNDKLVFFSAATLLIVPLVLILTSYTLIISTILRIHSSEGRQRTFSTCSSHFACVILFYVTSIFMYLKPSHSASSVQDRVASLFYTVVIPMFNPLTYSLRNHDVKRALKKAGGRACLWRICCGLW